MATHITHDGKTIDVEPKNGTDFSLSELQGYVGGYIELIHTTRTRVMVVNEEGLLKDLPQNKLASAIAGHPIVGDVLMCYSNEIR